MHVVSVGCTSIFFSVESRQARITGLVNALSDHFTSFFFFFFGNMRAKSSLHREGSTISALIFDHFSFQSGPAERSNTLNTRPLFADQRDLQMNV